MNFENKKLRRFSSLNGPSIRIAAIALVSLATCPAKGWAVDFTPDTTRYLSDPSFLPLQGQIFSETSYAHTDRTADFKFSNGATNEHLSGNGDHYSQSFAYGITDRLSVSAGGSYSDTTQHYSFAFGSPFSVGSSQFDNPSFAITYRAIEQVDSPVSLDVKTSYSPAAVDQTSQSGQIALFVNRELKLLTIQGEFGATYTDQYDGRQTSTATDHGGFWSYLAGLRTQARLTDRFAVNSGVIWSKNSDISYEGQFFRDSSDGTWSPYVSLTYAVIPDHVDLTFEYDHDFVGDDHRTFSGAGFGNGKWANADENLYAVHLRLLF